MYKVNCRLRDEKSQDPLHLLVSPFLSFGEIKTQRSLKIINSSETHLVVGPTTYFFVSISHQITLSIYF